MEAYKLDEDLKKEIVLKNTVKTAISKRKFLSIMALICIIAPIIVEIIAFLNYKDTSPDKPIMVAVFGSFFMLYGFFFLGFAIHQARPNYAKWKNEEFYMDNEKIRYNYTGLEGYARIIGSYSLTVRFDDIIELDRDIEREEIRLSFYDTVVPRVLKDGRRDTIMKREIILPLYFGDTNFVANKIENEFYQRCSERYKESNQEDNS